MKNAGKMREKTNIAVEVRHRAIKRTSEKVHPNIFKFIVFLRREQSAAEKKVTCLQARKEFPKNARYQKNALRNKNIFEGYHENRIELATDGQLNPMVFEKNMKKSYEGICDFLSWRLLAASWRASQNINMTGCTI